MIPAFPADATIMSIHLACVRAGVDASIQSSARKIYRSPASWSISNRYGYQAENFVSIILRETVSAEQLIERHSLFPFVSSLLTSDMIARWRTAIVRGHNDVLRPSHFSIAMRGIKSSHALRQCPICIDHDVAHFGAAHWHVCHQLPAVYFCQAHDQQLQDHCGKCGQFFDAKLVLQLPGDPCPACGSRAAASSSTRPVRSAGYSAYSDLVTRTLTRDAEEVSPHVRHRLMQHLIDTAKSGDTSLLKLFLRWWSVRDLAQLEKLLNTEIKLSEAEQLFRTGYAQVSTPFLLAAIAFAWSHTSETDKTRLLSQEETELDIFSLQPNPGADPLLQDLENIAQRLHLPLSAAELLGKGQRQAAVGMIGSANVLLLLEGLTAKDRITFDRRSAEHAESVKSLKSRNGYLAADGKN